MEILDTFSEIPRWTDSDLLAVPDAIASVSWWRDGDNAKVCGLQRGLIWVCSGASPASRCTAILMSSLTVPSISNTCSLQPLSEYSGGFTQPASSILHLEREHNSNLEFGSRHLILAHRADEQVCRCEDVKM